jgi:ferredoxin-NADP reductase
MEGSTYTHFLLISGGIGITPLQAATNQLIEEHQRGRPLDLCWYANNEQTNACARFSSQNQLSLACATKACGCHLISLLFVVLL